MCFGVFRYLQFIGGTSSWQRISAYVLEKMPTQKPQRDLATWKLFHIEPDGTIGQSLFENSYFGGSSQRKVRVSCMREKALPANTYDYRRGPRPRRGFVELPQTF